MAKSERRKTGDKGEDVASKYLEKRGYRVLERNYWKPWGEIDIVAKNGSILSFVEVKSVSLPIGEDISRGTILGEGGYKMRPEENVHPAKIKRLNRAIESYLLEKQVSEKQEWQIDVVCVYLDLEAKKARVQLLQNIVL